MIVYKYTSPSGKAYIGMTKNTLNGRFNQHYYASYKSETKTPFAYAICKYNKNDWIKEILFESIDIQEIKNKEIELIASHNTLVPNGYNILQGGQQGLYGLNLSEEHKQKQSIARKKYYESVEGQQWKQYLSETYRGNKFAKGSIPYNKGKIGLLKHTEEIKKIISEKLKGRKFTEEHKKNISEAKIGTVLSEETKKKISKKAIGHKVTEEHRKKVSDSLAKTFEIIWPDGKIEIVHKLSDFCKIHKLHQGNLSSVASGNLKHYKGFKCRRL